MENRQKKSLTDSTHTNFDNSKNRMQTKFKKQLTNTKNNSNKSASSEQVKLSVREEIIQELTNIKKLKSDYHEALQFYDLQDLPLKYKKMFVKQNHLTESAQVLIFGEVVI